MKDIKKGLIALMMIPCMGFVGCGKKEEPTIKSFEFSNIHTDYFVDEIFSIVGGKLTLTMSNGKTKEITISDDMIKQMPDMSTPGEKTIIIVYNSVEYSFTITVSENTIIDNQEKLEMVNKLNKFLEEYKKSQSNAKPNASVDIDFVTKFLNKYNYIKHQYGYEFNEQELEELDLKKLYDSIFDSIINQSFSLNTNEIVDAELLIAKLDNMKHIKDIFENEILNADYYDKFVNDFLLYKDNSFYAEKAADAVMDYLTSYNSIVEIANESKVKMQISNIINKYITEFRKEKHNTNFVGLIEEIYAIIKTNAISWVSESYKESIDSLITKAKDDPSHAFSICLDGWMKGFAIYDNYDEKINTTVAKAHLNKYRTEVVETVQLVENFFINGDYFNTIKELKSQTQQLRKVYDELADYLYQNNYWMNTDLEPFKFDIYLDWDYISSSMADILDRLIELLDYKSIDYYDVIVNKYLLPLEDSVYVENISNLLIDFFIEDGSVVQIADNQTTRTQLTNLVQKYITEFRKEKHNTNFAALIKDLYQIINTNVISWSDERVQESVESFVNEAIDNPSHALSITLNGFMSTQHIWDGDNKVDNSMQAKALEETYTNKLVSLIETIENIFVEPNGYYSTLATLIEKTNELKNAYSEIETYVESTGGFYYCDITPYKFEIELVGSDSMIIDTIDVFKKALDMMARIEKDDFYEIAINKILFTREDSFYVEKISNAINHYLTAVSDYVIIEDSPEVKAKISTIVEKYLTEIKTKKQESELVGFVEELYDLIQEEAVYWANDSVKNSVEKLFTEAINNPSYALSTIIEAYCKGIPLYNKNYDVDTSAEAKTVINNYSNSVKEMIEVFENFILDGEYFTFINDLTEKHEDFVTAWKNLTDYIDSKGGGSYDTYITPYYFDIDLGANYIETSSSKIFGAILNILKDYDENGSVNYARENKILEQLIDLSMSVFFASREDADNIYHVENYSEDFDYTIFDESKFEKLPTNFGFDTEKVIFEIFPHYRSNDSEEQISLKYVLHVDGLTGEELKNAIISIKDFSVLDYEFNFTTNNNFLFINVLKPNLSYGDFEISFKADIFNNKDIYFATVSNISGYDDYRTIAEGNLLTKEQTSKMAGYVYDLIEGKEVDARESITYVVDTFAKLFDFDAEYYINQFLDENKTRLFSDLIESVMDEYEVNYLEDMSQGKFNVLKGAIVNILISLEDFIFEKDYVKTINQINLSTTQMLNVLESIDANEYREYYLYGLECVVDFNVLKAIQIATMGTTVDEFAKNLITNYRTEVANEIYYNGIKILGLEESYEGADEFKKLSNKVVDSYINGTLNIEDSIADFFEIVTEYCSDEVIATVCSLGFMGVIASDKVDDYNEFFNKFIDIQELTNGAIKNTDYNKLVNKLLDENTYKMFTLDGVNVEYIEEEGKIVKEIMTLTLNTNFDILVSSVTGQVTLKLEIEF